MDILRLRSSIKDIKSFNLWQSLFAEFLGTFLLAFIGFGSVYSNMNPVKVGLGFGLAGVVIIYCIGPISGGNINPAVSFGLLIARQISFIRFILYFFVQTIGATFGCKFIFILANSSMLNKSFFFFYKKTWYINDQLIITEKIDRIDGSYLNIFCEMVISFVLVFTVMRLCVEKSRSATEKGLASLIIGISITIGVYCGMNISGGSMNPAVSLGKYIITAKESGYIQIVSHTVGPLVGGLLAGVLQQLIFTSDLSKKHIISYLIRNDFENKELSNLEKLSCIQLKDVEKTDIEKETKSNRNSQNSEHVVRSSQEVDIENEQKMQENP